MKPFKLQIVLAAFLLSAAVCLVAWTDPANYNSPSTTGVGIRSYVSQAADQAVTSSTALVSSDLSVPVAVSQHLHIRYVLPFALAGTSSGIKFQVTTPTGGTSYNSAAVMFSDADSIVSVSVITSVASQGFTLATIGNHCDIIEFDYLNGATAGNVVLQFAQNVSNASAATLLKGAYAEVVKL
jgi:hypothetical protein